MQINKWVRSDIVHKKNTKGRYDVYLSPSSDILDSEKLFEVCCSVRQARR